MITPSIDKMKALDKTTKCPVKRYVVKPMTCKLYSETDSITVDISEGIVLGGNKVEYRARKRSERKALRWRNKIVNQIRNKYRIENKTRYDRIMANTRLGSRFRYPESNNQLKQTSGIGRKEEEKS